MEVIRLLNLIKNEYIKLFKRGSIIGATIVLFVFSFLILFVAKVGYSYIDEEVMYIGEDGEEVGIQTEKYYYVRIESLKSDIKAIEDGTWKSGAETLKDLQRELEMFEFMLDNKIFGDEDWRKAVVAECFAKGYDSESKEINDIKKCVEDNDFEAYVRLKAKLTKAEEITYTNCDEGIKNIYAYMIDNSIFDPTDWRYNALLELENSAETVQDDSDVLQVKALNYRILNNMQYATNDIPVSMFEEEESASTMFMKIFGGSASVMVILCGVIIVIAGIIVATEHTTGTIKFLITNPVSRGKIIVSKYLTVVSLAAVGIFILFGFNMLCSVILCGTEGIDASHLKVTVDGIKETSFVFNTFIEYCLEMVGVIAYGTMAFAISSIAKSTSAAVATGIMSAMGGSLVSQLLAQMHQDWGRYLLFSNTSLSSIYKNGAYYPNQSVTFAITTVVIYVIIFFLIAYDGFTRREV